MSQYLKNLPHVPAWPDRAAAIRATRAQAKRAATCGAAGHDWRPDPACDLVDVCNTCGEERA